MRRCTRCTPPHADNSAHDQEAQSGGGIALIKDGDVIVIDATDKTIDVKISNEELAERKAKWVEPALKHTKGILYKYAKTVSSASEGCVTDKF